LPVSIAYGADVSIEI